MAQDNKGNKGTQVPARTNIPTQDSWKQKNESNINGKVQGNITVSETFQPPVKPVTGGGKK